MDAGLAAVLGALAGAVATVAATLVTGRMSRDQAEFAAKVEHVRQRREGRELAYRGFVSAATKVRDLYLGEVWGEQTPEGFVAAVSELEDRWLDATLAGPSDLAELATMIRRGLQQMSHLAADPVRSEDLVMEVARETFAGIDRFTARARQVLDDDGTRVESS
ncbi:hypothetical protein ACPCUV_37185 [Streptomyces platensis]|uniref:hypothetical protein n=1 Tax=Streptomyces platensis TaxID=58346 RepID=UPI003C304952